MTGEQSVAMLSLQLDAAGVLLENAMKENDDLRGKLAAANTENERLQNQIEFWTTSHEAICKNRDYLGARDKQQSHVLNLAVVMRELMRGKYGVNLEGPARHIAQLLVVIGAFDEAIEDLNMIPLPPGEPKP